MQETNEKLYTDMGGVYFPFAVGAGSGIHTASVLKNGNKIHLIILGFYLLPLMKGLIKIVSNIISTEFVETNNCLKRLDKFNRFHE